MTSFYIKNIRLPSFGRFFSSAITKPTAIVVRPNAALAPQFDGYQQYAKFAAGQNLPIEPGRASLLNKHSAFVKEFNEALNNEMHNARFTAYFKYGVEASAMNKIIRTVYQSVGTLTTTSAIRDKYAQGAVIEEILFLSRYLSRMNARGHTTGLYMIFLMMKRDLKKHGSAHGPQFSQTLNKYQGVDSLRTAVNTTCAKDQLTLQMDEVHASNQLRN